MYVSAVSYIEEKESKAKQSKGKEEKRNAKGINRREGRRMKSYSSQFHSPIFKISVWLYFKETVSRHCAWTKSCTKITTTTNTNISLLGSQAVKLMSQQQIAGTNVSFISNIHMRFLSSVISLIVLATLSLPLSYDCTSLLVLSPSWTFHVHGNLWTRSGWLFITALNMSW